MVRFDDTLPKPLQLLVSRALTLCDIVLPHSRAFYPFAAIYEEGRIGCLFADEISKTTDTAQLIEQLQWRIIDTTTDTNSYSVLVYTASVETHDDRQIDAIAINTSDPTGQESLLLYPFQRVGEQIVVSPPIHG
ncbi:hypothetical protein [Alteromonas halophila]|uniref:Uncharacterized protein n=1 Tax=Alteromonas halophila TaxID=516698 RepID=A0A918N2A3_9ALTE|nr:hypothetical protein [Alteromonas halophila]GGW96970.1 hypothetical protein GCM10007391_33840 [Alteromonas halophila]